MNTCFTAYFYDYEKDLFRLDEAMNGPQVFRSEEAAIDWVFAYVAKRILNGNFAFFDEYIRSINPEYDCSEPDEVLSWVQEQGYDEMKKLIELYFDPTHHDGQELAFSIEEIVQGGFIEHLDRADAVLVNGYYLDNMTIDTNIPSTSEEFVLDGEYCTGGFNSISFSVSMKEAEQATYDLQEQSWSVNQKKVQLLCYLE